MGAARDCGSTEKGGGRTLQGGGIREGVKMELSEPSRVVRAELCPSGIPIAVLTPGTSECACVWGQGRWTGK